jgi:23S rRNA pseudouridine2605 synthase
MLNKPKGVVTTVSDPEGRPTVMKFFTRAGARVFPVGRLDYQSEGLLLMTNDGELANVLTSAASQVEKTYLVKVSGKPTEDALQQLRQGVMIERGRRGEREGRVMTQPARISLIRDTANPWFEVVLTEGKNREIRKMFEEVGHFVEKVRRVGFGPLVLDVPPGEMRELQGEEVTQLKRAARRRAATSDQLGEQPRKPVRRPRSGPATLPRLARKGVSSRKPAKRS